MTESIKGSQEAEILSQLIDELNAGQQPESDDPETAELLAVAALIKKTGPVVRPPQFLLDQTVDKILADQPAKPTKRFWSWLHPGVLGAAASILLVVGFNLAPSWNSSEVQSVSAPAAVVERREMASTVQSAVSEDKQPTVLKQETKVTTITPEKTSSTVQENSPVPAAPASINSSPNMESSSAKVMAGSPPETAKKAPVLKEQAPVKAEQPPIMTEQASVSNKSGSINKAAAFTIDDPADRWPLPILSLPGQTPDEISSDKKTGAVRQVFWKGTPQEVIITQRRVWLEEVAAQTASSIKPELGEEKTAAVNSVTLILHSQEVTIEGHRSEQELTKIAKQLTSP
ncbi:MAG: hypothetical protein H6Q66_389 [Firmicutes bacterium]|nr:hypothetical protein [Bacillota bacterium]